MTWGIAFEVMRLRMKFVYLIITTLFLYIDSSGQAADFTYTTVSGKYCAPQTIQFTQTASGNPVSFLWDFGNGQAGNSPVEAIEFIDPGTYNVRLTVVYARTSATITKQITVNPTPYVTVSSAKTQFCKPTTVDFTATATAGATSYEWDFGDGTRQSTPGNLASHFFSNYGSYTITVTALTPQGCSSTASTTISLQQLDITGTATPPKGCIPASVNFSLNALFPPGDGLQQVTWNFGDGSPPMTGSSFTTNHTYNITTPISTASAIVTSNDGCTNTINFPVMAYGNPPADIVAYTRSGRDSFCGSEVIEFIARSTGANEYNWDLGNGINIRTTDTILSYKFTSLGNQRIIVRAGENGCGGARDTIDIYIKGVIALFDYSNTCSNKTSYRFNNTSLGNISWYGWKFSDVPGYIDSVNYHSSHIFPSQGVFTTRLSLTDSITGCRDSATVKIYTALPVLTSNTTTVCKDSAIVYQVMNTYPPDSIFNYIFHVTGGEYDLGPVSAFTHHPPQHGTFQESVVISDNYPGTCSDTIMLSAPVTVRGPIVDFNATSSRCADSAISLENISYPYFANDVINTWKWDFGNGRTSTVGNLTSYRYPAPGMYTISLTGTDINGCGQTMQHGVFIRPIPRVDILPPTDTLCLGESVELRAFSIDSVTWTPITNINCISCDTVVVNPTITTNYVAHTTNDFGCTSRDTSFIKVYRPFDLVATPSSGRICPDSTLQLSLNVQGITSWSPPDYLSSTTIFNPVTRPVEDISYKVQVTDSAGCFSDSSVVIIVVHPRPLVDAGPDQVITYSNPFSITPAYSSWVNAYSWSPPTNLSCSDCPSPSGTALTTTNYHIAIKDVNGCRASDNIKIIVKCEQSNLLLPSAFTPNRDGTNDYFYPITRGYRSIRKMAVFSRNGFKVFERTNFQANQPQMGWDGRIKGDARTDTQVFTWFVEGECETGETVLSKGTVIVIK